MHRSTIPATSPLRELRVYISNTAMRCRAGRWFGALFHVNVINDITRDVAEQQTTVARDAYTAEQYDLEALRILDEAARDGFSNADLPAVVRASRLIQRSAALDRKISDIAAA